MRKWITNGLVAILVLGLVLGAVSLSLSPARTVEANAGTQWNAEYYSNPNLQGSPSFTRIDDRIDFNWADRAPDGAPGGFPADNFSVRWKKTVNFPTSGRWTFRAGADDGIRMWIDATQIVNQWQDATGGYRTYEVSVDQLTAGNHDLTVEYYERTGLAGVQVTWTGPGGAGTNTTTAGSGAGTPANPGGAANWNGAYFNNPSLSGNPVFTRTDGKIDFNWADRAPDGVPNMPADNFSVRWTTTVNFPTPGHWHFKVGADDGVRMWVDATVIVDKWQNVSGFQTYEVDLWQLTAGNHDLKVEYYEAGGNAGVQVLWWTDAAGAGGGGVPAPTAVPVKPVKAAATGTVNVRTGPGLGYPTFTKIYYPDDYVVLGAVPDMTWIKIDLGNGSSGWVSNDWVYLYSTDSTLNGDADGDTYQDFVFVIPRIDMEVLPSGFEAVPPNPAVTVLGVTSADIQVRDGPSARAARVIASLPVNSYMTIEAISRNAGWYLMTSQGIRGWVSSLYVTVYQGSPVDLIVSNEVVPAPPAGQQFLPAGPDGQPVTVRGVAEVNTILRDAASLRGRELGTVVKGAEFVVDGRNRNGAWFLITVDGVQGWVYSPNVTLIEGSVRNLQIR